MSTPTISPPRPTARRRRWCHRAGHRRRRGYPRATRRSCRRRGWRGYARRSSSCRRRPRHRPCCHTRGGAVGHEADNDLAREVARSGGGAAERVEELDGGGAGAATIKLKVRSSKAAREFVLKRQIFTANKFYRRRADRRTSPPHRRRRRSRRRPSRPVPSRVMEAGSGAELGAGGS